MKYKAPILKFFLRNREHWRKRKFLKIIKYKKWRKNLKTRYFFVKKILYSRRKLRKITMKRLKKLLLRNHYYGKFVMWNLIKYLKIVKFLSKKERRFIYLKTRLKRLFKILKYYSIKNIRKFWYEKYGKLKSKKYKFLKYFKRLKYKHRVLIRRRKKIRIKKTNLCLIKLKHSWNNFFIIITDLNGKVINYITSGQVTNSKNKRKKLSHYLVYPMMNRIIHSLRQLKIKRVRVQIKTKVSPHVRKVIEYLWRKRFDIDHMVFSKSMPHHFGQRRRKLTRK